MKMRKKIAALLAAAMIASVMPMTVFAESANRVTQVVQVVKDGSTDRPYLEIEMKDNLALGETFYVKLENAKWNTPVLTTDSAIIVDATAETEIAVKAQRNIVKGEKVGIQLKAKDITGDAKVIVNGWESTVSSTEHIFAKVSSSKAMVTVGDAPSFYTTATTGETIAKFTIEEAAPGELKENPEVKFILDNDDFEFVMATAKYSKGLLTTPDQPQPTVSINSKDKQVMTVDFTRTEKTTARGVVELEIKVKSVAKKPATGDLSVNVSGDLVEEKDYKVAKIAEYGIELKAEKEYEFFAGRRQDVVFHLNEIVDDSMVNGRPVEFSLPKGVYFAFEGTASGDKKVTHKRNDDTAIIVPGVDYVYNKDKQITGFTVDLNTTNKIDKFKFEATLDITSSFEGDVVLTAEGRGIADNLEVVLAKVKPAIKVTIEPMTVKVGMKEQVGGKVVIEELEKGALQQGDLVISLEDADNTKITDVKAEVVSGNIKLTEDDVKTSDGSITLNLNRKSKEAAKIELTNIKVRLDRAVPEGAYNFKVGGTSISQLVGKEIKKGSDNNKVYGNDNIVAKDFLYVGEKYTKAEVVFNIGSTKFTVNGEEMTMDAEAYVKDGRTMVPVRYLSYALGISEDSIKFSNGVVTIFTLDGKVIQVKNNDKNLVVNGMSVGMVAAAEIKDGRTYVPVTEIGSVFGVTGTWDAASQTATFK